MENIIKQGYLKKARPLEPDSIRPNFCNSILQLFEPSRWYVFVLRNATPYLEIFDKEESVFTSQPINKFNLSECYKVTYTMARTSKAWTFCVFLENKILELSAESRDQMQDWCNHLERTLQNFGKLKQSTDHIYSDYPVQYTPRTTGLEQEQAIEAAAQGASSINTDDTTDDYQDCDFFRDETQLKSNGEVGESSEVPPEIPVRPKVYKKTELVGAEGGVGTQGADNSDGEPDTSEDDFVGKDFFVSQKVPPVPVRSWSVIVPKEKEYPLIDLVGKDQRSYMCQSVPPVPARSNSQRWPEKGPSFIESQPVPPPRRRKNEKAATISKKISNTSSIDDIESLDDGYDSVVQFRKAESSKPKTTEDPWISSLDVTDVKRDTWITKETGLFVKLPDKPKSGSPTPTKFLHAGPETDIFNTRQKKSSSSDSMNGVSMSDTKDENYNDQKENLYQFAKPISSERENLYDVSTGASRSRSKTPPIYDFGKGGNPEESKDVTHQRGGPSHVAMVSVASSPSSHRFSETDSLYSIPKSDKPVAGLSTEEVYTDQKIGRSSPVGQSLYAVPQKSKAAPRPLSSGDEMQASKSPSSSTCSSPKPASLSVSGKSPTEPPTMTSRPLPDIPLPPIPKLPDHKDTSLKLPIRGLIDLDDSSNPSTSSECRPSSPSHDGFHFNFGNGGNDSKSSTLSTSSGGASANTPNEEEKDSIYEDATGRNIPPVPPKRVGAVGRRVGSGRSVSVYIPSKGSGEGLGRLETMVHKESQDDDSVIRGSKVSRQMSLQERQQIRQASSVFTVIPLKQSQVELLCEEQRQHGVELSILNKSVNAIALVEFLNGIWIAGWDVRHFPRLTDKIHIGDQLISVEDIRVGSAAQAFKLMKQTRAERVSIVVKRMPYAKILAIRRNEEGESLGINKEGGTAEIIYVDPHGLAGRVGLTKKAQSTTGTGECNWMLSEINCRPLNLTFKGNEIDHLLNAVGKDISIVVQPVTFLRELKKQLKKIKNYKDYLT